MFNDLQNLISNPAPADRVSVEQRTETPLLSRPEVATLLEVARGLAQAGTLQSKAHIAASTRLVSMLGLPSHHDPQKDWDTLKVLYYILTNTEPGGAVLDAGSGSKSVILNWLNKLGYRHLFACDRVSLKPTQKFYERRGIPFALQELDALNYSQGQFSAVTCVSVVEHGVDLGRFFAEVARVLKPGGWLLISTDYWPEPIDCTGIFPYGEQYGQMKVFDRKGAEALVATARSHGLEVNGDILYEADEKAVHWEKVNRDYTFLFLPFRRS